jgi:hypothetical protein
MQVPHRFDGLKEDRVWKILTRACALTFLSQTITAYLQDTIIFRLIEI